jgi:L-amino acid N-acyltransferase YncA
VLDLIPYVPAVQPALEVFYAACFAALGWDFDLLGRHADLANIPATYRRFWCLFDGNELVGTVALREISSNTAELKRLYIHPARQGKGFGKLLFETALKDAKRIGYHTLCADTRRDRAASRHLMESHGFRETSQYNQNDFAELFYALDLLP